MFGNLLLHVQSVKTHVNTLRPTYTFGLGLGSFYLFLVACASGALLMLYYVPSVERAYDSVKDLTCVVFAGKLLRNLHKWAGEAMIVAVLLHMARLHRLHKRGASSMGRRDRPPRAHLRPQPTGYLLPGTRLSWALVIVANIMQSPREVTDMVGLTQHVDAAGSEGSSRRRGGRHAHPPSSCT
jgi:hypothetical protein